MINLRHDIDFLCQQVGELLVRLHLLLGNNLDSTDHAGRFLPGMHHRAKAALAQVLDNFELLLKVLHGLCPF